jgi:hypothetical protein
MNRFLRLMPLLVFGAIPLGLCGGAGESESMLGARFLDSHAGDYARILEVAGRYGFREAGTLPDPTWHFFELTEWIYLETTVTEDSSNYLMLGWDAAGDVKVSGQYILCFCLGESAPYRLANARTDALTKALKQIFNPSKEPVPRISEGGLDDSDEIPFFSPSLEVVVPEQWLLAAVGVEFR